MLDRLRVRGAHNRHWWPFALALVIATLALVPVASVRGPELPGTTALLAGGLIVVQLSTAFLFTVRFADEGRLSLLVLGAAFAYSACLAVAHLIVFPGALHAAAQQAAPATAWLFMAWRFGFGMLCLAAVLVNAKQISLETGVNRAVVLAAVGTVAGAGFIISALLQFHELLPPLLQGGSWTPRNYALSVVTLTVLVAVIIAIYFLVDRTDDIYQWLALSLGTLLFSHVISDLGGARYSVGWLVGRVSWFASAAVLFLYFMHQFWVQQQALSRTRKALQLQVADQAAKLEEAELMFSKFMQHLPGLAWIKDEEGRYTYVNEAARRAFGFDEGKIRGASDRELFPPETAEQFASNDREARRDPGGVRVIETLLQSDGTVHHSIVSKFPFPAEGGRTFVGGMAIDVTDRKTAEDRLRESETRFRELVEGLSDAVVWEGDPDALTFTFVSEAASTLLGYPRERWLTEPDFWVKHLHPDDRQRAVALCREETEQGRDHELEYRMIAADGREVWLRDRVYISERAGKRVSRGLLTDVTKWKRADEVLRHSEERFRTMTEHAPVMIWMSDINGSCVHLNRLLRSFWAVENEELHGFDWSRLIHPEDAADVQRRVQQALQTKSSFSIQARYRNAAGEFRTLSTEASPRYASDGTFAGMIGVNVDVTDLVRATEALRAGEERLKIATTAAGLGVFEWDVVADRADFENDRMCEIFGHAPQERHLSKEEFVRSYLHPEDAAAFERALTAALEPGAQFNFVCRIRPKASAQWRWIEAAGNFKRRADGAPMTLVGVVADITDRKRAEDELIRSSALLRAVSEGTSDMIFVKDRACRVLYANPATLRVVGLTEAELLGTTGYEWQADQGEVESFLANDRKVIDSGELITTEETFTGADGTRTYLSIKAPMRDPSGGIVGLIGVSRDITERKQAEQHTHMLLREVSHRAKNMLAVAQAIVRQSARDADPQRYADVVSARLGALGASHDLLVQSEWRSVGMRELILSQLAHLAALVNDRIILVGPDVRLRPAAAQAIGMALHELATNAQKHGAFNGPDGSVKLSWGRLANGARDRFEMQWLESGTGTPAVSSRRGFGHSVLTRMVEHALDADVVFEITAQGAEWQVSAPSQHVLAGRDGNRELTQEGSHVRASPDSRG